MTGEAWNRVRSRLEKSWSPEAVAQWLEKKLLDRLVPVTGLNRSYLATVLGNYDRNQEAAKPGAKGKRAAHPEGKRGGRPVKYGEGFEKVLCAI
jgi:hypothetical protein